MVVFSLDHLASLCGHLVPGEAARVRNARLRDSIDDVPIGGVILYKIDHRVAEWRPWPSEPTCRQERFLLERRALMLKSRTPQSEYTMNIFYIIGVIVVVLFVASFFGLR